LSKREYIFLEHLRDIFVGRVPEGTDGHRVLVSRIPKRRSKRSTEGSTSPVSYAVYEPSKISNVFDSEYWQWRRYKAYYRYVYGEESMEKRYREVEEFMKG
jgi:hypothetical protein